MGFAFAWALEFTAFLFLYPAQLSAERRSEARGARLLLAIHLALISLAGPSTPK
jgi:hypothetical protein